MSLEALHWAYSQEVLSSSKKYVLVTLAYHADVDTNRAWPTIQTLARETALDRKTVIQALKQLVQGGFITDTGDRAGRTKSVTVYLLPHVVPKTEPLKAEAVQKQSASGPEAVPKQSQKRDTEPEPEPEPESKMKGGSFEKPKRQRDADRAKPKAWDLKQQLEALDVLIAQVQKRGFEDATGLQLEPKDWAELKALKTKRAAINETLAALT